MVILNFKLKNEVLGCLESVRKSTYNKIKIIVVDNNSGDGLEDVLKGQNDIVFIQSGDNLGYTGGNNLGIKRAIEMGVGLVFVLNPDTEIEEKAIENLVIGINENNAGVVGPKIYFSGGKTIWYAGGKLDLANVIGGHRGVDEEDSGKYEKVEETDFVTGAAMMVRSEVFQKIGNFDERYFLYYEDADFSYRARKAGFKVMYIPSALVYHANAKATGLGSARQDYYMTRNRLLFASKFLSFRTRFALIREALRNFSLRSRRVALADYLLGRFGKGSWSDN